MNEVLNHGYIAPVQGSNYSPPRQYLNQSVTERNLPPLNPLQRMQSAQGGQLAAGQRQGRNISAGQLLNYDSDTGVQPRQQNLVGGYQSDNTTVDTYKNINQAPLAVAINNFGKQKQFDEFESQNKLVRALPPIEGASIAADQALKVRSLEMNLIDFKGQVDRRLTAFQEEMPATLTREIKAFESREQQLSRDIGMKLNTFQELSIRTRDALKHRQNELTEGMQKIEVKNGELEYKLQSAIKQIEIHGQMLQTLQTVGVVGQGGHNPDKQRSFDQETQIQFLRDQLTDERQKRETALAEAHRSHISMGDQMRQLEFDIMKRIKEQRDQQSQFMQQMDEERTRLVKAGGERQDDSALAMRNLLTNIERKVDEEIHQRHKDMQDSKEALEQKLVSLVDKLKGDEKQGLERERRLMEQVQDGLNTMNEIIKGTKEQNQVSLSHQTTVMGEQMSSQSQTVTDLRSYVSERQSIMEHEISDIKQRLLDLEEATLKHVNHVNSVIETEMSRFEKVIAAIEKHQVGGIEELKQANDLAKAENSKWRIDYEDANSRRTQEIHQAIQVISQQLGKTVSDWKERADILSSDIKLLENSIQAQIAGMKDGVIDNDAKFDQRVAMVSSRLQEKIKIQVDESLNELKNRFNENLELIESKFKQNNAQVKAFIEKNQEQSLIMLNKGREEKDIILEGKAQAFTIESERKLIQKINMLFGRVDALKEVVSKREVVKEPEEAQEQKPATAPRSVKSTATAVDEERMRQLEAQLKKWSTSKMREIFQDFERLVEAKNGELRALIVTQAVAPVETNLGGGPSSGDNLMLQQQLRTLEISNQNLKIDMVEKVSFEQLKFMLNKMEEATGGQKLTTAERDNIFDRLKKEQVPQDQGTKTRRSLSQVELPGAKEKANIMGSAIETESFQGYEMDGKSQQIEQSFRHEYGDDKSGLEQSAIRNAPINISQHTPINISQSMEGQEANFGTLTPNGKPMTGILEKPHETQSAASKRLSQEDPGRTLNRQHNSQAVLRNEDNYSDNQYDEL